MQIAQVTMEESKEVVADGVDGEKKSTSSSPSWGIVLGGVAILGVGAFLLRNVGMKQVMTDAVNWIRDQGEWGPIYYVGFLSLWVTALLPCTVLEIVPGFLFGWYTGFWVSMVGKSIGSAISLVLGRYLLKDRIQGYVLKRYPTLKAFSRAVELEGFKVILMIRVAYLPMLIKNYGLSVLDISISEILVAGLISGLPFAAAWSFIGSQAENLAEVMEGKASIRQLLPQENQGLIIGGTVFAGAAFLYVAGRLGKRFREILQQVKEEEIQKTK